MAHVAFAPPSCIYNVYSFGASCKQSGCKDSLTAGFFAGGHKFDPYGRTMSEVFGAANRRGDVFLLLQTLCAGLGSGRLLLPGQDSGLDRRLDGLASAVSAHFTWGELMQESYHGVQVVVCGHSGATSREMLEASTWLSLHMPYRRPCL